MILSKPAVLILIVMFVGMAGFVFGQPSIKNPVSVPITYCSDSVAVAPNISIQNISIDQESEGMKISIANYVEQQDQLVFDRVGNFNYFWDDQKGTLEIKGIGSDQEYEQVVSKVYYKNLKDSKQPGVREFSISLLDADYLPKTEHFYLFIPSKGIRWTEARNEAEKLDYYGLKGYLATITSAEENDFIYSKIDGVGWIGASDAKQQGKWIWETGPEAGRQFWQGTSNGYSVNGQYANWNYGEPNNLRKSWGDYENYAHMVVAPGSKPRSWNDLSDEGDKDAPNGYYYPQGFVVEFGGMPGDPLLNLSATAKIEVIDSQHPQLDFNKIQTLFCGTKSTVVNLFFIDKPPVHVELLPLDSRAIVDRELTFSPEITVEEFGKYYFLLNTVDEAGCDFSDTILFEFHNQPVADFSVDEESCSGYSLAINFVGLTVEPASLKWTMNGETIPGKDDFRKFVFQMGFEQQQRTIGLFVNEQGCADFASFNVKVQPANQISISDSTGCSPKAVQFDVSTGSSSETYQWNFGDENLSSEQNPRHVYENRSDELQVYSPQLTVNFGNCVNSQTFSNTIRIFPIPTASFEPNPDELLITDPGVVFQNTSHAANYFLWNFGDSTDLNSEFSPEYSYERIGIFQVSLGAYNDFGCADTTIREVVVNFDRFFPPNAFSPNATLDEDKEFRIYGDGVKPDGYRLQVFNRWGEPVFTTRSMDLGWNGTMKNGGFAPAGVYTWVLQYIDVLDKKHTQTGEVTLLY